MLSDSAPRLQDCGTVGVYARLETWLRLRRRLTVGAIVAVALVLRVSSFLELAASPCFWLHEWDQSDMHSFHNWALAITHGDLWSKHVHPPLHNWHREIADDYAKLYPDEWERLAAASAGGDPDAAARAVWDRWFGCGRTYQGPLYPYLIAGTYHLLGPAVGWIFAAQMALGIASIVLIHVLARRLFDHVAALGAATLALCYAPLIFYEFVLLRAALIAFGGLLLALLLDRAAERQTARSWLALGIVLGFAVALKAHFILMLFAAIALLVVHYWRQWNRFGRCLAGFVTGLLISFSPVVTRNAVAGAPLLSIASNGPPTLLVSNVAGTGVAGWDAHDAARILAETEGAFLPTLVATLRTHPTLASYLGLFATKLAATWDWYEAPNNANFYYGRLHSEVLRSLPVTFALIGPASLVGLALALPRLRRCAPLYALVLANLAVLLIFFTFARFRVPLAAALAPFAGYALARVAEFLSTRRWIAGGAALLAIVLPAIVLTPTDGDRSTIRPVDVEVGYQVYYDVLVRSALARNDLDAAAAALRESLGRLPAEIRDIGPGRPAQTVTQIQLAAFYAGVHQRLALVLQKSGQPTQAETQLRRATELRRAIAHPRPGIGDTPAASAPALRETGNQGLPSSGEPRGP